MGELLHIGVNRRGYLGRFPHSRRCTCPHLHVEEYRFRFAGKMNIQPPITLAGPVWLSQQRMPQIARHQSQHRIILISHFTSEINSRRQPLEQSASQHAQVKMRRLQRSIRSRHSPRLNGFEPAPTFFVGRHPAKTKERIFAPIQIFRMSVPASRIRLARFQSCRRAQASHRHREAAMPAAPARLSRPARLCNPPSAYSSCQYADTAQPSATALESVPCSFSINFQMA